jgi:integrase
MKLIQLWLGHANYSTTADIYAHLNASAQDVTAGAIVEALGGCHDRT